jgi:hypothetical protein
MIKRFGLYLSLIVYVVLACHVFFGVALIGRLVTVPENHIGFDIRTFNYLSFGLIGLALLTALFSKNVYAFILAAAVALASMGGLTMSIRTILWCITTSGHRGECRKKGSPAAFPTRAGIPE